MRFAVLFALTVSAYAKLPLVFEENRGQTDARVRFLARGNGYTAFLTPNGATISLGKSAVTIRIVGARTTRLEAESPLESFSNYFIGNDPKQWVQGVRHYDRVRARQILEGIDLVYHGSEHQLEYDLEVAPGANTRSIRLKIDGAQTLRIGPTGDLLIQTKSGDLAQHKPLASQGKQPVDASYSILRGNEVAIVVGAHNAELPLTIDPIVSYSTYLGGSGSETINAIAADMAGSAYVTGSTSSIDFPATMGTYRGGQDAFVAKLNPGGTALNFATYIGGANGTDVATSIAFDGSGDAFITGNTTSTDFPVILTSGPSAYTGYQNSFVTRVGYSGLLVASRYLAGSSADSGRGIAMDLGGNVYVTGTTGSSAFPVKAGGFLTVKPSTSSYSTCYVVKLDSDLKILYATYLGGNSRDTASAIAVDSAGNAYVTGSTNSSNFPATTGAFQTKLGGTTDAFLSELNPQGSALVYSTFLGGTNADSGSAIALDAQGNAYVAGVTQSTDFPTTPQAFSTVLQSTYYTSAFVTKVNVGGATLGYSGFLGTKNASTTVAGIVVDSSGDAFVLGATYATDFPVTPGSLQRPTNFVYSYSQHFFLTRFNAGGSALNYSTYLGSTAYDTPGGIALDGNGGVYVAGETQGLAFPVTASALQLKSKVTNSATNTGVVTKIDFTSKTLCNVVFAANAISLPALGGTASFAFTTDAGCPWVIYSDTFITMASPMSGFGNGTVTFTALRNLDNSYSNRTGTITVSGGALTPGTNVITVTQAPGSCTDPAFDNGTASFDQTGGLRNIAISLTYNCPWNLANLPPWINASNTVNSAGSGTLALFASPNPFGPRQASITLATKTILVTQAAGSCSLTLTSARANVPSALSSGSAAFTTSASSCLWNAYPDAPWIQVKNVAGQGSAAVSYTVSANPGSVTRTSSILIGDQTFQMTQEAGPAILPTSYTSSLYTSDSTGLLGDQVPVSGASVSGAMGMAFDTAGRLYIAARFDNRIRRVDTNGIITTFAGGGSTKLGDGGLATDAKLTSPSGVTVQANGDVYIADTNAFRIRRVSSNVISTIAGLGYEGYDGSTNIAISSPIEYVYGIAVDAASNVIFADTYNNLIRRISPDGTISTFAGNGYGFAGDGGNALRASLSYPKRLVLDSTGTIYFEDSWNYRVRKVAAGIITTVAGNGTPQQSGDGGPATLAGLSASSAIAIDPSGSILIGDENGSIRRISPDGIIRTIFTPTNNGWGVDGLAVDTAGNIFTAQSYSISKLTPTPSFCSYTTDSPAPQPAAGGSLAIAVTTSSNCSWSITSNVSWITAQSGTQIGSGSASLTISGNQGANLRTGVIIVAGQNVTITQLPAVPTFTFTFNDAHGIKDINGAQIVINSTLTAVNSCYILYGRPNLISLADDSGSHYTSTTLGVPAVLQNSQCLVLASQASQTLSGNTITLNLTVVFKPAFAGAKNVWTNLSTASGGNLGWVQGVSYTATAPSIALSPVSVNPSSGVGQAQAFTINYFDTMGAPDSSGSQIVFNPTVNSRFGCYLLFNANNLIALADDNGYPSAPVVLGSQVALQNSQCTLFVGNSYQTQSGQNLSVTLFLAFKPSFAGTKNIYASLANNAGTASDFVQLGTWTVPASAPAFEPVSMSPAAATGPSQVLTFVYADPYGFENIGGAQVNIGTCQIQFSRSTGAVSIGTSTATLGSASTIQDSQCSVNAAASRQFGTGNYFILTLFVTMKTGAGKNTISSSLTNNGSTFGPTIILGAWTVSSPTTLTPVSTVPATGAAPAGTFQPFTFTFSDPAGSSDIDGALILFYPSLQGANACYILWGRAAGITLASNDATTFTTGALGSTTLLQNSQCIVDPSKTFFTETGSTVNLTVAVAFKAPFQAFPQIYSWLNVGTVTGVFSGWNLESRFTVQ